MREKKNSIGRVERVLLWFALAIGVLIVGYNLLYVRGFSAPGLVIAAENTVPGTAQPQENGEASSMLSGEVPGVEGTPRSSAASSGKLNLNEASASELSALLPGVGDTLAARIIEYREAHGGFSSLAQLKEVQGIGETTYENILPYITLS